MSDRVKGEGRKAHLDGWTVFKRLAILIIHIDHL
jgi:hypothetical protein